MNDTLIPAIDEDAHSFSARRPKFDFRDLPLHWVPGDPHTTHVINISHLTLPSAERWFSEVFRDALPMIKDERLRGEAKAFIGQESVHAHAHEQAIHEYLNRYGIDATRYVKVLDRTFAIGRKRVMWFWLPGLIRRWAVRSYTRWRLAFVAAAEHFTAVMGWWLVVSRGLDRAGVHPEMLELFRWHSAEEVEHRSVAFDAYRAAGGRYARRVGVMCILALLMLGFWIMGANTLMRQDRTVRRLRVSPIKFFWAAHQDLIPPFRYLVLAVPRYMAPWFHPSRECRVAVAADYISRSRAGARLT